MSMHNNTFIDAYGLELNDELNAKYAEPTRPQTGVHQPGTRPQPGTPAEQPQPGVRSYRFDAATRRLPLRGPHFRMPAATTQSTEQTLAAGGLDMNVIDVGAAWSPSPIVVQPSFDTSFDTSSVVPPSPRRAEPPVEAAPEQVEPSHIATVSAEEPEPSEAVAAPIAPMTATATATEAAETAPRQHVHDAEAEATELAKASPVAPPTEPFAPVWEVDRFHWPDDIEQLFKAQTDYFDYAGKKLVAASREGLNVLAVTSTRPGEGSTTLALCLARAAAGAGAKVGLLDGNLLRSELGDKLGVDFASGWQAAATHEQPLAEAAITGLEEGITLFPSAATPVAGLESLADHRVGDILRAAAANYDLLIVDAGRADLGSNIEVLDAAIVVRDIRHTSEAETLAAAAALRNGGVKAVGIAENFGSSAALRAAA